MNEVLINLLNNTQLWEIAFTVIGLLIAKAGTSSFIQNAKAKRTDNWQNEVIILAEEAVSSTYNDIVRDAKAAGVFDNDKKEEARFEAKQRMIEIATQRGSKALMSLASDAFDRYIEKAVNNMKADAEISPIVVS